jgi:hypothetical protein
MDILWINKKGHFLDVLENFHIYDKKQNIHLNGIYRDTDNPTFNVVIAHTPWHCTTQLTVQQSNTQIWVHRVDQDTTPTPHT